SGGVPCHRRCAGIRCRDARSAAAPDERSQAEEGGQRERLRVGAWAGKAGHCSVSGGLSGAWVPERWNLVVFDGGLQEVAFAPPPALVVIRPGLEPVGEFVPLAVVHVPPECLADAALGRRK